MAVQGSTVNYVTDYCCERQRAEVSRECRGEATAVVSALEGAHMGGGVEQRATIIPGVRQQRD